MKTLRLFLTVLCIFVFLKAFVAIASEKLDEPVQTAKSKTCFQCAGVGEIKCTNAACKEGQTDCPGPCVKRSGKWEKRDMPGNPPNLLWQKVNFIPRGSGYISQAHIGEYFTTDADGKVSRHACQTCNNTSVVTCIVCRGKSVIVCSICEGKKTVPEPWSAFDNPKMKVRPSRFTLKDGGVIIGYKKMASGSTVLIRTEKGDQKVAADTIASEKKQPTQK